MKRTAQEEHVGMLIKLAHEHPQIRDHVMPVIQQHMPASVRLASSKLAFSDESAMFVAWCLMKNDKWSVNECQALLDRAGIPMQEGTTKQTRGPLSKGEMVKVQAVVNANPKNTDICQTYDGLTGSVTDIDGDAVVVTFDHGKGTARFDGTEPGKKTGLGRHTPISEETGKKAALEVIYISEKNEKPPSKLSLKLVEEYVEKGMKAGENRSDIFHSGMGLKQALNKEGQYYFSIFSAQRDQYPRSISPVKGQLLYLGLLGKRPGGWKSEFAQMVAKAEDKED